MASPTEANAAPAEPREPSNQPSNPTVSWFELFYDLVVVAAVNITNDKYLEHPSGSTAILGMLGLTALCWVWFVTTLGNNVYPELSTTRRVLMLVQMVAFMVAALGVDFAGEADSARGLLMYGVALAVAATLILLATRGSTKAPLGRLSILTAVGAVICIVAGLVAPPVLWPYLVLALVLGIAPLLAGGRQQSGQGFVLRADHMRERLGLFVLIILGDGFLLLVQSLAQHGSIPNLGVFAMTFAISFSLWWIYFGSTFSQRDTTARPHWRLTLLAHLTLVFGMIGTLDCLVLFTVRQQDRLGEQNLVYFAVSVGVVLLSFAVIGYTVRDGWRPPSTVQALSGLALPALCLALTPRMEVPIYGAMTVTGAVVLGNAVFAAWWDRRSARIT